MFLETIRCENGLPLYLSYHQQRVERTFHAIQSNTFYNLQSLINPPKEGVFRCRFLYNSKEYTIEYHPYTPKKISSLKLITCNKIEYPLKYIHRETLDSLFEQRGECDDVLIIRNDLLTDTTIANIALQIEGNWLTPNTPLLMGTTRARLIDTGFLTSATLHPKDVTKASKIALMNAMLGFIEVENGIIA
jgi:4-amino-4-deoxychorismate lyase